MTRRYHIDWSGMDEAKDGEWVMWDDHVACLVRIKVKLEEIARLTDGLHGPLNEIIRRTAREGLEVT